MINTLEYYSKNADAFFEATVNLNLSPLYDAFLPYIPPGGAILDAGCGSGRDAKFFVEHGFQVSALDPSPELAIKASRFSGVAVELRDFAQIDEVRAYHGIWCCASLLHVPYDELPDTLSRLYRALKPGGVLYLSFKYGDGEGERNGRWFTNLNLTRLADIISEVPLTIEKTWRTSDLRPKSGNEMWLNAVLSKGQDRGITHGPRLHQRLNNLFFMRSSRQY